jgi:hypothetical protein
MIFFVQSQTVLDLLTERVKFLLNLSWVFMKILRFYISEEFFIDSTDWFPRGITFQFGVHVFDCFLKLCLSRIVFESICEIPNIKHKLFSINVKIP